MSRTALPDDRPVKVIVSGSSFGRFYLKALKNNPRVHLAGLLSTGSRASQKIADGFEIDHYTQVDEIPQDVQLACVVVRAGVSGGAGANVARSLLGQKIHVLQEHPLHPAELAECYRAARENGVRYFVNAFYPYVSYVADFLRAAALLRKKQSPLFIDAMCGAQVLYPLLDIIGRASGSLRPFHVDAVVNNPESPYTTLTGELESIPLNLRVQNQIHPSDADNHALLLHRLAIGFDAGVLTLADTHGPVIWSPRLHTCRDRTHRLVLSGHGTERLNVLSSEILSGPGVVTFRDIFDTVWPDTINRALDEFISEIRDERKALHSAQWTMSLAGLWQKVIKNLGPPDLIYPAPPEEIRLSELISATNCREAS